VNSEFNWWLLILGAVIGAGPVWIVLADSRRREADVAERERESEARWIGEAMRDAGRRVSDADALDVLRLHEAYLAAPPPDEPDELEEEPAGLGLERAVSGRVDGSALAEPRAPMAHPMERRESVEVEPSAGHER
jgi:hypothetical protein